MSDELSVEATGETVGEAKWAAVRELERLAPRLDRETIRFQVVSEGERGLLGVGFTPARVVATAAATAPQHDQEPFTGDDDSAEALTRGLLERTLRALDIPGSVTVEQDEALVATLVGPDLGVVIGRHGQMIDALQVVANALAHHRLGDDRPRIVIDAAGYRARRAEALEEIARRAAERAVSSGVSVSLEPMSSVERRLVHEVLKDDAAVETASEGAEPHRYVVVVPRASAG